MYEEGSEWYKRLKIECEKISPHIRFIPVKMGFVRIYWDYGGEPGYIHEVYRWMPYKGYDLNENDPRFESKRYFEEYEDSAELTLKLKNFVEGYYDSINVIKKRIWLLRNSKDGYKEIVGAYREMRVR
jgi:hypothetical protein